MSAGDNETKRCWKCGGCLPIVEFHNDKTRKDGLSPKCKKCEHEYYMEHNGKNRERRNPKIQITCDNCGKLCSVHQSVYALSKHHFCNRQCNDEWMSKNYRAEGNPNWQGGFSSENQRVRKTKEYREWREAVFARDNWTCQDCGERGAYLHPHHVFEFAEFKEHRFEVWNGASLCVPCHAKYHSSLQHREVEKEDVQRRR